MLLLYIKSIFIWTVIIYISTTILFKNVVNNGWLKERNFPHVMHFIRNSFSISLFPIWRLIVLIGVFYMAINKKKKK